MMKLHGVVLSLQISFAGNFSFAAVFINIPISNYGALTYHNNLILSKFAYCLLLQLYKYTCMYMVGFSIGKAVFCQQTFPCQPLKRMMYMYLLIQP